MENFLRDFLENRRYGYGEYRDMFNWEDYKLGEGPIWFSFELETGKNDSSLTSTQMKKAWSLFPVICASDSSIPANYNYEWISQPMSWDWFKAHKEDFIKWVKYLKEIGLQSQSLNNSEGVGCGLHIHVTKVDGWEKAVGSIWLFTNTYKEQHAKICGRKNVPYASDITNYYRPRKNEFLNSIEWLQEQALKLTNEHAIAINLQHSHDIEFRQCVGTLNEDTLMARFEYFNNLYRQALSYTRIDRFTFSRVVKGEFISKYARKVDAISLAVPFDTTRLIKAYTNQLFKLRTEIIDRLSSMMPVITKSTMSEENKYTAIQSVYELIASLCTSVDGLESALRTIKGTNRISRRVDESGDADLLRINENVKEFMNNIQIPTIQEHSEEV
jgi:hypothetical protein